MIFRSVVVILFSIPWVILSSHAIAQCVSVLKDGNFSGQHGGSTVSDPWHAEGNAGMDKKYPHVALLSNSTGWNAIYQPVQLSAGKSYTLKADIQTSVNVRDGVLGFRDSNNKEVVQQIKFGPLAKSRQQVTFRPTKAGQYYVFAGFLATNKDAWIRIYHVDISFPCEDVILNP